MQAIPERLIDYLERNHVAYTTLRHSTDYTAQEAAADTHTPGREFAKTVLLKVDGEFALAVLPAHHKVDLELLRDEIGAREVEVAPEQEMRRLCPDCDVGALPPFGNLYGLPVHVSAELQQDEEITFNAGSHQYAIRMRYTDFERLVGPRVNDFSWVG